MKPGRRSKPGASQTTSPTTVARGPGRTPNFKVKRGLRSSRQPYVPLTITTVGAAPEDAHDALPMTLDDLPLALNTPPLVLDAPSTYGGATLVLALPAALGPDSDCPTDHASVAPISLIPDAPWSYVFDPEVINAIAAALLPVLEAALPLAAEAAFPSPFALKSAIGDAFASPLPPLLDAVQHAMGPALALPSTMEPWAARIRSAFKDSDPSNDPLSLIPVQE